MLTSRLDRCYSNSSTHAPGYEINYPPPPSVVRSGNTGNSGGGGAKGDNSKNGGDSSGGGCEGGGRGPKGIEVPPPLPPKTVMNTLAGQMRSVSVGSRMSGGGGSGFNNRFGSFHPQQLCGIDEGGNSGCGSGGGGGFATNEDSGSGGGGGAGLCVSATWSGGLTPLDFKASSLLDSHDRFKPEKNQRRPVQRMKWSSQSRWGRSLAGDLFSYSLGHESPQGSPAARHLTKNHPNYFNHISLPPLPVESESRVSSMTIADVSPRIAVKKVLVLYEHAQYGEAANFINRLSVGTFRIILRELPMDVFVEAMPHSLPILDALYTKIFTAEGPGVDLQFLKPEAVVMHMVKFFSREDINQMNRGRTKEPSGPFTVGCKKILGVIVVAEPALLKKLQQRGKTLDKTVEGMGQHGLVGTTDESLTPLHDALKLEFQRVVETYKGALGKLEELSLSAKNNPKSVAKGPAPVNASHQRQLSLRVEEIQERLIKNKSVLNAVEQTLDNHCLDILLGILQRRIQVDKEALFQFTQLRKETGDVVHETLVAPLLMRYSRGCKQVLEMMREVGREVGACMDDFEDDSSDLSGYHSDSDSAIMTSGNSPFVTPRARYNFLSRSVRSKQVFRPSLLNWTGGGGGGRSIGKSSGPGSTKSFGGSSFDSSLSGGGSGGGGPDDVTSRHLINPAHAATPCRPRHVKMKNQLHKNNSLGKVSTASSSTGSDSSTSGCGTSLTTTENPDDSGANSLLSDLNSDLGRSPTSGGADCVECVTVVSVPDNQVITQGLNHRCAKGHHSPASSTSTNSELEGESDPSGFVQELRIEIAQLKRQLQSANSTIYHMQEKSRHGGGGGGGGGAVHPPHVHQGLLRKVGDRSQLLSHVDPIKEDRRSQLVREYGALYAQARVETMDALDSLSELIEADELKSKLLFSVVVLAFRSVQTRLAEIKDQVSSLLQFDPSSSSSPSNCLQHSSASDTSSPELEPCQSKLVEALSDYLSNSQQKFDQSRCVEHVANQLWTTLYDYPCLRKCEGLLKYIRTCVNLAWGLSNQTPACVLEYEKRVFSRETHVRFHSSDPNSEIIKTYLWPALMVGLDGPCIHKGVVIT